MELISGMNEVVEPMLATAAPDATLVTIPVWLEMLAIIVCAGTGVLSAREYKLDCVGAVFLGLFTGLAGGLIRDLILQSQGAGIYILDEPLALPIAIAAGLAFFFFPVIGEKYDRTIDLLDIFGVGLFSIIGADKALVFDCNPVVCVLLGFLTAVGGGMIRDMCLARVPNIFRQSNFYATASMGGAAIYLACVILLHLNKPLSLALGVAATVALRYLSIHFDIRTPVEVDLTPVVVKPLKRVGRAVKRASTRTTSAEYVTERRERVVADIDKRRAAEKRRARRAAWRKVAGTGKARGDKKKRQDR